MEKTADEVTGFSSVAGAAAYVASFVSRVRTSKQPPPRFLVVGHPYLGRLGGLGLLDLGLGSVDSRHLE